VTDEQLKLFRERLATARQPEHKLTEGRTFIRGWNACLDHVEKVLKEVLEGK